MQRITSVGTVAVLPTADDDVESPGYFTEGNPGGGVEATEVDAKWLNNVQEEICAVIEDLGLTLDKAKSNQMVQALRAGYREIKNLGLATSVSGNALTVSLKDRDGSDPSVNSQVIIPFRHATLSNGSFVRRRVSSALSVVVSSGSTLGTVSGVDAFIYVYAIDNAGTVELAVSRLLLDEGKRYSTTAEGGAGAADSNGVLYSTTARSNVAIRLIGRLLSNQTTAGTWAAAATEIALAPFAIEPIVAVYETGTAHTLTNNTDKLIDFGTKVIDNLNCVTTGASWKFTAPKDMRLEVITRMRGGNNTYLTTQNLIARLYKNGSLHREFGRIYGNGAAINVSVGGSVILDLVAGDYIHVTLLQNSGSDQSLANDSQTNYVCIKEIPKTM